MTKRDKQKEITKSKVRKSALALFSVVGYYQTSIAEIATKSSTFIEYEKMLYHFFKEKGCENPDIEAKLFTSSLMGICIQYIANPSEMPIKKIMKQFTHNIIAKRAKT